ncbi:MAG: hypothetical protein NTX50_27530, partial [Candidatus Sumerlaeota bacterium]|nr:hypothetical protein [Candidatus Sumerlaeota bacterium]
MIDADFRRIAKEIYPILSSGKCIAWVGSGFSMIANYYELKKLIIHLCESCNVSFFDDADEPSFDSLAEKADECKKASKVLYHETLAEHFGQRPSVTRIAYTSLLKLPFCGYVTT